MPVNAQAVVNVNVNSQPFDDFMEEFKKYVALLGKTPAAWAKMTTYQKQMFMMQQQGTAALMAQNAVMMKNVTASRDAAKAHETSARHWETIKRHAKDFGGYILHAHEHIMRWGGILSGIVTGMGAASGWGLWGLGKYAREGSITSGKLAMTPGQVGAAETLIGNPYGIDVKGLIKKVNTAAGDASSQEALDVNEMGIRNPGNLRGLDKLTAPLQGLMNMLKTMTPQEAGRRTGMDASELTILKEKMPQIEAAIAKLAKEAERQDVSTKKEDKWNDFITQIESFTKQLKAIMLAGLEPLLDMITQHKQEWLDSLRKFMADPAFKKFLADVPTYVEAIWKAAQDFAAALKWLARQMGWITETEEELKLKHEKAEKLGLIKPGEQLSPSGEKWLDWKLLGVDTLKWMYRGTALDPKSPGNTGQRTTGDDINDWAGRKGAALMSALERFGDTILNAAKIAFPKSPEGSHQEGTPYVNKTGSYTLHKGEAVLPEADADLLRHSTMAQWKRSISGIEGGYGSENPITHATGKYQVMPANIGSWTKAALGYSMSQEQFKANPAAQERVFEYMFGSYVSRFGNPLDAAAAWFTGQPIAGNRSGPDAMGTTLPGYLRQFLQGLGGSAAGMNLNINDNTGGNVAISASQMATIGLSAFPV